MVNIFLLYPVNPGENVNLILGNYQVYPNKCHIYYREIDQVKLVGHANKSAKVWRNKKCLFGCGDNTRDNLHVTPHRTGFSTTEFSKDLLSTCPASTHTNSLPNINSIFLQSLDVFKDVFSLFRLKNYHIFVASSCFKLQCPHPCDNYGDGAWGVWALFMSCDLIQFVPVSVKQWLQKLEEQYLSSHISSLQIRQIYPHPE